MTQIWTKALGVAGSLAALAACSGGDSPPEMSQSPSTPLPSSGALVPGTVPGAGGAGTGNPGVDNYDRPLGMPIGQGASPAGPPAAGTPTPPPDETTGSNEDIDIPVFMPMDQAPPCSGCIELQVDVNDINQRDNFVFAPGGGTNVTRVVWTIVVPFNSDQLFVQPFVDNSYGTFTDLDANAFLLNTPIDVSQDFSGPVPAGTVGIAVGSSGAWTGNMTMSVFVDAVTLEGAPATASRTFDTDAGGFVVGSNTHNPKIVYHP